MKIKLYTKKMPNVHENDQYIGNLYKLICTVLSFDVEKDKNLEITFKNRFFVDLKVGSSFYFSPDCRYLNEQEVVYDFLYLFDRMVKYYPKIGEKVLVDYDYAISTPIYRDRIKDYDVYKHGKKITETRTYKEKGSKVECHNKLGEFIYYGEESNIPEGTKEALFYEKKGFNFIVLTKGKKCIVYQGNISKIPYVTHYDEKTGIWDSEKEFYNNKAIKKLNKTTVSTNWFSDFHFEHLLKINHFNHIY